MLSTLRLLNFRCFEQLVLDFSPRGAIFTGDNAQGKTSVLEAICLLIRLHSPRTRRLKDLAKFGGSGFGISGQAWDCENQVRFQSGKGLSLKIDGEDVERQRDYLASGGLLVWMANDDLDLVRGSSSSRRRYLDFIGTQLWPDYRLSLGYYSHALKCRNRLLKAPQLDSRSLAAYEQLLVDHGTRLIEFRKELVDHLKPFIAKAQAKISGTNETFDLEYQSQEEGLSIQSLSDERDRDRQRGSTQRGPHRDDLSLQLNGQAAASFASEGQQRTLSISLKLAQGTLLRTHTKRLPIYLIDDVFGELDSRRRQALIEYLPTDAQTLITTTQLDWLDQSSSLAPLPLFHVDQARISPINRTT